MKGILWEIKTRWLWLCLQAKDFALWSEKHRWKFCQNRYWSARERGDERGKSFWRRLRDSRNRGVNMNHVKPYANSPQPLP